MEATENELRAELDRLRAENAALRIDRAHYEETMEALGVGNWAITINAGEPPKMYGNHAMDLLLGVAGEQLTPEAYYHAWYDHVKTDHYREVDDAMEKIYRGQYAEVQYPFLHPTRGEIWVRCSGKRDLLYTQGIRIEGRHQNVTGLVHIQKSIEEEREASRRVNEARTFFFSTVSHDIRTPLNAIIGYSDLLKANLVDEEERVVAIDNIDSCAKTLLRLINDVLDLAKLDSGKMDVVPEPTDLRALVHEVLETFRAKAIERGVELSESFTGTSRLLIDPQRMRQIILNLVGNAVKFTSEGRVTVRCEECAGRLTLSVADTGVGIAPEDLSRIMKPFSQTRAGRRSDGTGLGLAICKSLSERMGGTLTVVSELGKGSTFTMEIPCSVAPAADASTAGAATDAKKPAAAPLPQKVLFVDDSPVNRLVGETMLRKVGIRRVVLAKNGEDALKKLDATFDLVLTDLWMPIMDGREFAQRVRADRRFARLPVYVFTADVEEQKNFAADGFTGLVLKPLSLDRLCAFFRGFTAAGE